MVRKIHLGIRIFAAVVAAASVLSLGAGVPRAADNDTITVGTGIDPGFAHFYVAKAGGFWQKRGLNVDVKLFPAGARSFASIIAGDLVAADGGGTGCILAANRSPKVVLVAGAYESDKFFGVVSKAGITTPDQLKGKTLATAMGTDAEFYAEEFLKRYHMTRNDVNLVNLDAPEMIAALNRGDIDAYTAWEPWITRAQQDLGSKVRVLERSNGYFFNHTWICADRDWAKTDAAQRFMQGILDADAFMRKNPAAAAKEVADFLHLQEPLAKYIMGLATFDIVLNDRTVAGLVKTSDWLVSKNKMKPLDYKTFIYPDLLKKVDPQAVSYKLSGG